MSNLTLDTRNKVALDAKCVAQLDVRLFTEKNHLGEDT